MNPFVCEEDSDVESSYSDDSSSDGSEVDPDSDESYVAESSFSSASDSDMHADFDSNPAIDVDVEVEVDPSTQKVDNLNVLTARNAKRWLKKWLGTPEGQSKAIIWWHDSLRDYHFCKESEEVYLMFSPWQEL